MKERLESLKKHTRQEALVWRKYHGSQSADDKLKANDALYCARWSAVHRNDEVAWIKRNRK
jgi:hypothetical protein